MQLSRLDIMSCRMHKHAYMLLEFIRVVFRNILM